MRFLTLLVCSLLAAPAAQASDDWLERQHASLRLISAGSITDDNGGLLIGLDVKLAPDWQFYHADPGKYGVAPVFDWSQSGNAKTITPHWPEPQTYSYATESPISTRGYKDALLLPITVSAGDAGDTVTMVLDLEYAVCAEYCEIDTVTLELTLPPGEQSDGSHAERLRAALKNASVAASH